MSGRVAWLTRVLGFWWACREDQTKKAGANVINIANPAKVAARAPEINGISDMTATQTKGASHPPVRRPGREDVHTKPRQTGQTR